MAATDPVVANRKEFSEGDVSYLRTNSEAIMKKFAGEGNFINKFQTDTHRWCLNGSYGVATGITFFDGVNSFFYNTEIVGVSFWNGQSGASGTTEFDLRWIDTNGVDQGSIFSTTPKINSTSSSETVGFRNLTTSLDVSPTGVTLPTFSKTVFAQGDSVYLKLNGSMISAKNCGLAIFYRPIN
jgi:hypothetical protein